MIESFKLPNINAETVSGSICSFSDEYGNLPLKSCVSQISGYQEGSGTPSPSNVRPLHAFSSATLTENNNTHLFTFGQNIYQGYIDWKRGVVVGTHLCTVYDGSIDENWKIQTTTSRGYYIDLPTDSNGLIKASWLIGMEPGSSSTLVENSCRINTSLTSLLVKPANSLIGDLTAFTTYLSNNPLQVSFPIVNTFDIQLGGIQLLTQEGVNNIYCDTGDTTLEWLKVN